MQKNSLQVIRKYNDCHMNILNNVNDFSPKNIISQKIDTGIILLDLN